MTNDRIDELIVLASLGELTDDESMELDVVARSDAEVATALDQALTTAAALQRTHAESAPAGLRAKVLDAIASTPQTPQVEMTSVVSTAVPIVADVPVVADTPVVALDTKRRPRVGWLAAAAAVVMLIGGAVVVTNRGDGAGDDQIASVLTADDVVVRELDGQLGEIEVSYSSSEGALVVSGDDVATLPTDATYQLWLLDEVGSTSVGIFQPDSDGAVDVAFDTDDPTQFRLAVTREPSGGSSEPTLPIIAST